MAEPTEPRDGVAYVLGHADREMDRLDLQGVLYRSATEGAFRDAGLGPGMRVLDLGCGSGDVSFLAAEIVGAEGRVTGIDREASAIEAARARARNRGVSNTAFEVAESLPGERFDALLGRFVLMHQPDPGGALATAARSVRAGGIVVMVESQMNALAHGAHSFPFSPIYDRVVRWKCQAVAAAGADLDAGFRLRQTFVDAGLPAPTTRLHALVEGGEESLLYRYNADSVRSIRTVAESMGAEPFPDKELDTLEQRLRAEVVASGGVLVAWPVVSAWCRMP